MAKYQFIHIEAVSQAGRDIYRKINGKKEKVGNISVDSVLGEAGRLDGYISHIDTPLKPVILYGDNEKGIEDVREKFKKWKNETKDARGHKTRGDANGLLAGVISWPPISKDDEEKKYFDDMRAFEQRMLEELKKKYGDDLILVLRHDDEPFKGMNYGKIHYHWHFYCVKKPGVKFDLHHGFKARAEYNVSRNDRKNMTKEEIKEKNKNGMKAYKEAMKEYQNWFHTFGKEFELERYGPMRIRRSRGEQVDYEDLLDKQIYATKNAKAKAGVIIVEAETEANKIKQLANADAEKTKASAWKVARDITNDAEKNAASIFEKAKSFVEMLLEKIAVLQGGQSVVNWARTFIKPKNQLANTQSANIVSTKKEGELSSSHSRSGR